MKKAIVIVPIMAVALALAVSALAVGPYGYRISPSAPPRVPTSPYPQQPAGPTLQRPVPPGPQAQPVMDPNKVMAAIKAFEGLQQQLDRLEASSRNEVQEWLRQSTFDHRTQILRAVENQMRQELLLLRQLAAEEKANKTLAAIDGVLLQRQQRFRTIMERLQQQSRSQRMLRSYRGSRYYQPRRRYPGPRYRSPAPQGSIEQNQMIEQGTLQPPRRRR